MDIEENSEWEDQIRHALQTCNLLVALLTPGYRESPWTDQEIGWALGRQVPVVAIRRGIDPYGFIGRYQAIRGSDLTAEELATKVFDVLWRDREHHPLVEQSVAYALAESHSFAQTRLLYRYIREVNLWSSDMIDVVQDSLERNRNVYDAWYGSRDVSRLLEDLLDDKRSAPPSPREIDDLPFE